MTEPGKSATPDGTKKHRRTEIPDLPVNATIGEIGAEIDSARHDAAEAAAALVNRVSMPEPVRKATNSLRWNGRRVAADLRESGQQMLDAAPDKVAEPVRRGGRAVTRVPWPVYAGIAVLLFRMIRRIRRRRAK